MILDSTKKVQKIYNLLTNFLNDSTSTPSGYLFEYDGTLKSVWLHVTDSEDGKRPNKVAYQIMNKKANKIISYDNAEEFKQAIKNLVKDKINYDLQDTR